MNINEWPCLEELMTSPADGELIIGRQVLGRGHVTFDEFNGRPDNVIRDSNMLRTPSYVNNVRLKQQNIFVIHIAVKEDKKNGEKKKCWKKRQNKEK